MFTMSYGFKHQRTKLIQNLVASDLIYLTLEPKLANLHAPSLTNLHPRFTIQFSFCSRRTTEERKLNKYPSTQTRPRLCNHHSHMVSH